MSEVKYSVRHATAEDILNLFNEIDTKKTGTIKLEDMIAAARSGKLEPVHHKDSTHDVIREDLEKFDTNHDGNISIQEFFEWIRYREGQLDKAFKQLEAHSKGEEHKVEEHASRIFGRKLGVQEAKNYLEHMLRSYHQKKNSFPVKNKGKRFTYKKISGDEIIEMFTNLDADGDGVITLEDLIRDAKKGKLGVLHHRDACVKYIEEADTNHDGKVTISEFRDYVRKREVVIADLFWHMDKHMTGVTPLM